MHALSALSHLSRSLLLRAAKYSFLPGTRIKKQCSLPSVRPLGSVPSFALKGAHRRSMSGVSCTVPRGNAS